MNADSQNLFISVESLRNRITSRLIPLFFLIVLITSALSLARIPSIGFQPLMILQVFVTVVIAILFFARTHIRQETSALVMVGVLVLFLVLGVATFGLLSVTFIIAPIISLYLMLLGYRKSAYASTVIILLYLSLMAVLFVSGTFESPAPPTIYVRSSIAWILMIVAVGGVSVAFVAPFELVPGALLGSEERFSLAFENANVGICLTSLEGRLAKVNSALCQMLGYDRQELERMNVSDITHPDDIDESLNFIEGAPVGRATSISFQKRYIHKRGDLIWAEVASSLVRDSQGKPQYFITHIQNITLRKQAEEAMRESEGKLRAMFESSKDAIGVSKKGIHIYANPSYLRLFGFKDNESIIGTSILESIAPSYRQQMMQNIERRYAGQPAPKFYEARGMRIDGTEFDAEFNVSTYELKGEIYSLAIIRDITERKRAEEALRQSEARYRTLIENTPDIIAGFDEEGRYLFVNSSVAHASRLKPEEFIGKKMREVGFSDEQAAYRENSIRSVFKTKMPFESEFEFEGVSGKAVYDWRVYPVLDSSGKVLSVFSISRNITERKTTERALRSSEEKFHKIFHASPAPMSISTMTDGKYIDVNESFLNHMELEREDVIGKTALELNTWADERERIQAVNILRERGSLRNFEAKHRTNSGTIGDSIASAEIIDLEGDQCILGVTLDITERKRAEDALKVSVEQLHALTRRLESVREEERKSISREVHDELGQVLTALRMDLMTLKKTKPTQVNEFRKKLESMLDLTANAINSVQNISARLRPGMLDDLGLVAAVEWQIEDFQKRSGIACTVNLPDREPSLDNQRTTAIFRILQETLTNVARHAHARHVTVDLKETDDDIAMVVRDDGIGIPAVKISDPNSYGLLGIRERLRPFEGTVIFEHGKEGGTEVTVKLRKHSSQVPPR